MTDTASHSVPERGKFRRALASFGTFLQALDSSTFDYMLDRIERLEGEVGRLKEELRQSRDPGAVGVPLSRRPIKDDGSAAENRWWPGIVGVLPSQPQ